MLARQGGDSPQQPYVPQSGYPDMDNAVPEVKTWFLPG